MASPGHNANETPTPHHLREPEEQLTDRCHIGTTSNMERVVNEPRKRMTARVSENIRATLEQAAELLGATVNQFVVQTAYQEAQRILERESVIRLFRAKPLPDYIGVTATGGGKEIAA
jgi:hypothetical protein